MERKAGWDTQCLPVELGVEKELNITKEDIGGKLVLKSITAPVKMQLCAIQTYGTN